MFIIIVQFKIYTQWPMRKYKISNILKIANRAEWTKIWDSEIPVSQYVDTICHFGVIRCTSNFLKNMISNITPSTAWTIFNQNDYWSPRDVTHKG